MRRPGRGHGRVHAVAAESGEVRGAELPGEVAACRARVELPRLQAFHRGRRFGAPLDRHGREELRRLQAFQLLHQPRGADLRDAKVAARERQPRDARLVALLVDGGQQVVAP
jgi:hypothetical protein